MTMAACAMMSKIVEQQTFDFRFEMHVNQIANIAINILIGSIVNEKTVLCCLLSNNAKMCVVINFMNYQIKSMAIYCSIGSRLNMYQWKFLKFINFWFFGNNFKYLLIAMLIVEENKKGHKFFLTSMNLSKFIQ